MPGPVQYGARIRRLRQNRGLTQAALAERLGVSTAYLNLIENDRRRLTPELLIRITRTLNVELDEFGPGDDARIAADLEEVFSEPLFEETPVNRRDVEALVVERPDLARAVLRLHQAYATTRSSAESLAARAMESSDLATIDRVRLSSEQVSEFIQRHMNHFPELESAAKRLIRALPERERSRSSWTVPVNHLHPASR